MKRNLIALVLVLVAGVVGCGTPKAEAKKADAAAAAAEAGDAGPAAAPSDHPKASGTPADHPKAGSEHPKG